jgi:hypothetical protein
MGHQQPGMGSQQPGMGHQHPPGLVHQPNSGDDSDKNKGHNIKLLHS